MFDVFHAFLHPPSDNHTNEPSGLEEPHSAVLNRPAQNRTDHLSMRPTPRLRASAVGWSGPKLKVVSAHPGGHPALSLDDGPPFPPFWMNLNNQGTELLSSHVWCSVPTDSISAVSSVFKLSPESRLVFSSD